MEIKKINVTPGMASKWLETINTHNRKISPHSVKKYAADMKSGNWRDTHQNVIALYTDGTLADGQHRLSAVVEAGIMVPMHIATGLSRTDASVLDQGRKRSVADALQISGLVHMERFISQAPATVKLIQHAEGGTNKPLTVQEIAGYIEAIQDGIEFACAGLTSAQPGIRNAVVRSAVAVAYYQLPRERLERFCRVMTSGINEGPEDITLIRLRNWLIQNEAGSGKMTARIEAYRTVVRVIAAYRDGVNLQVIRKAKNLEIKSGLFDGK